MKRWIILTLAFLLVGAVINVAVASWFALSTRPMPVRDFRNLTEIETRTLWDRWGPRPWSEVHGPGGMLQILTGRDLRLVLADAKRWPDRASESQEVVDAFGVGQYSYGWPRRSMSLVHVLDTTLPVDDRNRIVDGLRMTAQEPDLGASVVGAIPLRPIWPGFMHNTLLFTLALAVAFAVPIAAIRFRRHLLGRCIRCGYPIGVSDVCTECGRRTLKR